MKDTIIVSGGNTLQNIPGIAKTETFISLDELIDRQITFTAKSNE